VPPSRRLIAPSGCCVVSPRRAVVLSSRRPLTPNVTCGARDDGGHCHIYSIFWINFSEYILSDLHTRRCLAPPAGFTPLKSKTRSF
jgi:hypothetical protein